METATTQSQHTQGEILMKFINSDAVEIYSITPKHKTICIIKCHDVNSKQVMTYEELKANAERIVKSWNMHDELVEKLKLMTSLCRLKYGNLDKEVYSEIEKSEQLLKQTDPKEKPAKVTSHLTTIIGRVKHRLEVHGGDIKKALNDSLFRQSVNNLIEYQESWTDFTKEEQKEADELYAKYSPYCKTRN